MRTLTITLLLGSLLAGTGCRTTESDVRRWANTQQGPRKLVAVLQHDKYSDELRTSSAITLVTMRPRKGRRIGIEMLAETLATMPPEARARIIDGVIPVLTKELGQPPPEPKSDAPDASIAYKDAAVELLTHEGTKLIDDPAQEKALRDSLRDWAVADFAGRMDAPSQKVGMEQMMRVLGPNGVRPLPSLIKPEAPKISRLVALIAEVGDAQTKEGASKALVTVGQEVASKAWLDRKAPAVKKANEESGIKVDDKRFQAQLAQFQEEELMRIFGSMKRVGGVAAIDFLLGFAKDAARPEKQRAAALAALEGNLDKNNQTQIDAVLALAKDDNTPDIVRDLALRRIGEMPRPAVIDHLYGLFDNDNWKVRWAAAEHILKMSEGKHIDEFMKRLGKIEHMAISEPLHYGKLLGELKGDPTMASVVDSYTDKKEKKPLRFTALGYYYQYGTTADLEKVSAFAKDKEKVPECAEGAKDCEWKCADQELETLGDFAEHCVVPAIKNRTPKAKPAGKAATPVKASQDGEKKE